MANEGLKCIVQDPLIKKLKSWWWLFMGREQPNRYIYDSSIGTAIEVDSKKECQVKLNVSTMLLYKKIGDYLDGRVLVILSHVCLCLDNCSWGDGNTSIQLGIREPNAWWSIHAYKRLPNIFHLMVCDLEVLSWDHHDYKHHLQFGVMINSKYYVDYPNYPFLVLTIILSCLKPLIKGILNCDIRNIQIF